MQDRKASGITHARRGTISRRAWIEKALASVRSPVLADEQAPAPAEGPQSAERPHLYLVVSNPSR